jgi:hypothetical protein
MGVVTFSDSANVVISLSASNNNAAFIPKVRNIPFLGGYTATWEALTIATTHLTVNAAAMKYAIPRLAIIVTDGQSQTPSVRVHLSYMTAAVYVTIAPLCSACTRAVPPALWRLPMRLERPA